MHRYRDQKALAVVVALLGGFAYLLHSWISAHGQLSVLDEGLYLYKGFLFASGRYVPFADNGPWTNHMPLSFLIPGWIQLLFEPGIRTGRYAAIILGLLMILGLWISARRLGGLWPAAGVVWIVALNPALVKIYSQFSSQVLVAFMMAWIVALTAGRRNSGWKIYAGTALAAALALTRLNMLPVVILLLAYIFWTHGRRAGLIAGTIAISIVGIGHAVFWPDILKLWANWIPPAISPFLDSWRESAGNIPFWDPSVSLELRLNSLMIGIQRHLLAFIGFFAAILAWPYGTADIKKYPYKKYAMFLMALFVVLLGSHTWASIGQNYCVYCFQVYLTFFSQLGLLLLVIALAKWMPNKSGRQRVIVYAILLGATLIIAAPEIEGIARSISATQVPRLKNLRILLGTVELSELLFNRFGLELRSLIEIARVVILSWFGLVLLSLAYVLVHYYALRKDQPVSPTASTFVALSAGMWLILLSLGYGNGFRYYDCGPDVIASYEEAGQFLQQTVPSDALVYWVGGLSPVPLLYLPEVKVFPAQLNQAYTYRIIGESEELARFGFWNQDLATTWLQEAEIVLIEERMFGEWITADMELAKFDGIGISPSP
jgi:hypothetical protein